MCSLVQLIDNKTIRIHEYPTLKFQTKYREMVNEFGKVLRNQNVIFLVINFREKY